MPAVPAEADCPNCRIPLAIPGQPNAGEIDCPVCTLALYYAQLRNDDLPDQTRRHAGWRMAQRAAELGDEGFCFHRRGTHDS